MEASLVALRPCPLLPLLVLGAPLHAPLGNPPRGCPAQVKVSPVGAGGQQPATVAPCLQLLGAARPRARGCHQSARRVT